MRVTTFALLVVAAAGCEKTDPLFCKENPGATGCPRDDGDVTDPDMEVSGDMDPGIDARLCFGAGNGSVCLSSPPSGPVIFTNATTLSTTAGVSTNPVCLATQPADWAAAGQPDACFIVGTSIRIDAKLTVTGNRPLVLLSSTTITINAELDAASHGTTLGPGAPDTSCKLFTVASVSSQDGGGGGAGGSFMSQGAPGGEGDNGNAANGVAGAAEGANPQKLRAGCSGQSGGDGQNAGNAGIGGGGGGAVYLLAGDAITLMPDSLLNASGGGGGRAGRQAGGGGGGAGGMIMLYAPSITATDAKVMANGGGGSSGGDDSGGTDGGGMAGNDPADPTTAATGGTGTNDAGDGGDGFFEDADSPTAATAGQVGASARGGGGGGGGKGWIQSNLALTGATVSPAVVVIP